MISITLHKNLSKNQPVKFTAKDKDALIKRLIRFVYVEHWPDGLSYYSSLNDEEPFCNLQYIECYKDWEVQWPYGQDGNSTYEEEVSLLYEDAVKMFITEIEQFMIEED